jgi:hypothetical protein
MVAGQKISYLPGSKVNPGGYLHGKITTAGEYCYTLPALLVTMGSDIVVTPAQDKPTFRIFPNPTTGQFNIDLGEDVSSTGVIVTIYGPRGELVRRSEYTGLPGTAFSLSDKPSGLYYVRVVTGTKCYTAKLIRH